jgi:hypothetical protein
MVNARETPLWTGSARDLTNSLKKPRMMVHHSLEGLTEVEAPPHVRWAILPRTERATARLDLSIAIA